MIKFTDSHCHITLEDSIDEIITKSNQNNIYRIINNGCNEKNNEEVISISEKYTNVYSAIGIHPEDINKNVDEYQKYYDSIDFSKIIAIGEIGLDYLNGIENRNLQKEVFRLQLEIALKNNKPVIIHTRNAMKDTIDILKEYPNIRGVIHCFDGSVEDADTLINLGFKLGFNGIITFKNYQGTEVIEHIPLQSILLETDAPYLAPVPMRGKKNDSSNIIYIANKICDIKQISLEELSTITENNIKEVFDI